ncbi:MAG TPA: PA14 domain-containing protein [Planctomycetota bacterium]
MLRRIFAIVLATFVVSSVPAATLTQTAQMTAQTSGLTPASTTANLSTDQGVPFDWVHWGKTGGAGANRLLDRKANVTGLIGNFTDTPANSALQVTTNLTGFAWTDGTPNANSAEAAAAGTAMSVIGTAANNGFSFTVPASTQLQTLRVYVGLYSGTSATAITGKLTLHLSDTSAPDVTDTSVVTPATAANWVTAVYYVNFAAGDNLSRTLSVTWQTNAAGGAGSLISLAGATLNSPLLSRSLTTTAANASVNLTNDLNGSYDWLHLGRTVVGDVDRKANTAAAITVPTVTGTSARIANNPAGFSWTNGTPTAAFTEAGGSGTGVAVSTAAAGDGFSFTVPAGTAPRVLKLYVGVNATAGTTTGKLTLTMNDSSLPAAIDASVNVTGGTKNAVYTITYAAASATQLKVDWQPLAMGTGYVSLSSVTLSGGGIGVGVQVNNRSRLFNISTDQGTPNDWVHWGTTDGANNASNNTVRKAGVTPQISNWEQQPNGTNVAYAADNNNQTYYTWAGGTPTATATEGANAGKDVTVATVAAGYMITVPADSTVRVLKLFCGLYAGTAGATTGQLTLALSDGSAPVYIDGPALGAQAFTYNLNSNYGVWDGSYTIVYAAAAPGQTLKVTWIATALGTNANCKLEAASLLGAAPAADTIAIKFQGSGTALGSTDAAGVVVRNNWNNVANATGTLATVLDNSGATVAGCSVTYAAFGTSNSGIQDNPGNFRMMRGHLDTSDLSTTTVTVSGLPASFTSAGYSVYVYADGNNITNQAGLYTIGNTSQTLYDAANFGGAYARAYNSAGNYLLFKGLTTSSFTLTAVPSLLGATPARAPVNAIQVVIDNSSSTQVTYTWQGGGGNSNFNTAANWVGGVAPTGGVMQNLLFPAGAVDLNPVNNLPANTDVGSISVTGDGYTLTGNALNLNGSLVVTGTANVVNFNIPVKATSNPYAGLTGLVNLYGQYFNNTGLTGVPSFTRFDPNIDYNWGGGGPGNGLGNDNFTIRWTGTIVPPTTDTYRFDPRSDDGLRLWVNGALVVNQWLARGVPAQETAGAYADIPLTAGMPYSIVLEYQEQGANASCQLYWKTVTSGAVPYQIVPLAATGTIPIANVPTVSVDSGLTLNIGGVANVWDVTGYPLSLAVNGNLNFAGTGASGISGAGGAVFTTGNGRIDFGSNVTISNMGTVTLGTRLVNLNGNLSNTGAIYVTGNGTTVNQNPGSLISGAANPAVIVWSGTAPATLNLFSANAYPGNTWVGGSGTLGLGLSTSPAAPAAPTSGPIGVGSLMFCQAQVGYPATLIALNQKQVLTNNVGYAIPGPALNGAAPVTIAGTYDLDVNGIWNMGDGDRLISVACTSPNGLILSNTGAQGNATGAICRGLAANRLFAKDGSGVLTIQGRCTIGYAFNIIGGKVVVTSNPYDVLVDGQLSPGGAFGPGTPWNGINLYPGTTLELDNRLRNAVRINAGDSISMQGPGATLRLRGNTAAVTTQTINGLMTRSGPTTVEVEANGFDCSLNVNNGGGAQNGVPGGISYHGTSVCNFLRTQNGAGNSYLRANQVNSVAVVDEQSVNFFTVTGPALAGPFRAKYDLAPTDNGVVPASINNVYTSVASGTWDNPATWTPAPPVGGPVAGDMVIIQDSHNIALNGANRAANFVKFNGSGKMTGPVGSGFTLAVGAQIAVPIGTAFAPVIDADVLLSSGGANVWVDIAQSSTLTITGAITETGGATKIMFMNTGTLVLNSANSTFSGGIQMMGAGLLSGGQVVANGLEAVATIQLGAATTGAPVTRGPLGTGTLTMNGSVVNGTAGPLTIGNALAFGGNVIMNSTQDLSFTGNVALGGNRTITLFGTGLTAFLAPGVISGGNSLTMAGPGTLLLTGANTFSGGFTINYGTLQLGVDSTGTVTNGPLGTGTFNIAPSAPNCVSIQAFGAARTVANTIALAGDFIVSGTNDLKLGRTGQNAVISNYARSITVNNGQLTIDSPITGAYGLAKNGPGTLLLTQAAVPTPAPPS